MADAQDPLEAVVVKLLDAGTDARTMIVVSHGLIEVMVNTLVGVKCKHGKEIVRDTRGFPHSVKLMLLNELGVIDDVAFEMLDRLRRVRNDAVHGPFFEIDSQRVRWIVEPIERDVPPKSAHWIGLSDDLGLMCANIVHNFWAEHRDVLGPQFAPKLYEAFKSTAPDQQ